MSGWMDWMGAGTGVVVEGRKKEENAKSMLCPDFQAQLPNIKYCMSLNTLAKSFECPLGCWREHTQGMSPETSQCTTPGGATSGSAI